MVDENTHEIRHKTEEELKKELEAEYAKYLITPTYFINNMTDKTEEYIDFYHGDVTYTSINKFYKDGKWELTQIKSVEF